MPAPFIRHLLASHRAGQLSAQAAAAELGLAHTRFYKLYSQYLQAWAAGQAETWSPRVSGGDHRPAWPSELNALLSNVSDPTNCLWVTGYEMGQTALGLALAENRVYVADGRAGLVVLPALLNMALILRIEATPGVPFTLEATTNVVPPVEWTPMLTTNVATMPFDFVDYDMSTPDHPRKFYRVH